MTRSPIRAVFTDLDGTLFHAGHIASAYTTQVVNTLCRLGRTEQHGSLAPDGPQDHVADEKNKKVYFIVATGRPFPHVQHTLQASNLKVDFIIANNGALIYNDKMELICSHFLPVPVVRQLLALETQLSEHTNAKISTNMFKGNRWYTNNHIKNLGTAYPKVFQPREVKRLHGIGRCWRSWRLIFRSATRTNSP